MPYVLDVKTVTGVVFGGRYHPVRSLDDITTLAQRAFRERADVLLEVAFWTRPNPRDPNMPLALTDTNFFKLTPATPDVVLTVQTVNWLPPHFGQYDTQKFLTDSIAALKL